MASVKKAVSGMEHNLRIRGLKIYQADQYLIKSLKAQNEHVKLQIDKYNDKCYGKR